MAHTSLNFMNEWARLDVWVWALWGLVIKIRYLLYYPLGRPTSSFYSPSPRSLRLNVLLGPERSEQGRIIAV